MAQINWKLDPEAVKRRALSIRGCKEIPSNKPATLCFLVGMDENRRKVEELARINVFVDTGTIGTCRVQHGEVREVFRRNVNSLDVVERLLTHPPKLTEIDDNIMGLTDTNSVSMKQKTLKAEIELADVGLAILQAEEAKLVQHLESIDLDSSSRSKQSSTTTNTSLSAAGMEFQFSLPPQPMKHVDQCLGEIHSMGKIVRGVSTNGKGTVFLYGNGGVAYTPNIPKALYHKLSQLRSSAFKHRPAYVSLGTRDRYFVSFHDNTFAFKGPKSLEKELKKSQRPPRSVAFGSAYDTYACALPDGTFKASGRGLPRELSESCRDRKIQAVNLGPDGEWFFRTVDGEMAWGGVNKELEQAISELREEKHKLNFMDFGEDGSYFVSYD